RLSFGRVPLRCLPAPLERGPQVVMLDLECFEPLELVGPVELRLSPFREIEVIITVSAMHRQPLLSSLAQLLGAVHSQRFEQPIPHAVVALFDRDERLLDQAGQQVEEAAPPYCFLITKSLGGFLSESTGEH